MPKFKKTESELETSFDKWCYVLKHLSEFRRRPRAFQEKVFKKLFKEAEIAGFTEEERMRYEQSLKKSRDYRNTIATAFEEGKEKGKAEGRLERDKEFVRKAIEANLPVSTITKVTGLSKREIEKIKKQLEEES